MSTLFQKNMYFNKLIKNIIFLNVSEYPFYCFGSKDLILILRIKLPFNRSDGRPFNNRTVRGKCGGSLGGTSSQQLSLRCRPIKYWSLNNTTQQ